MKYIAWLVPALLLTACSNEETFRSDVKRLDIDFADVQSRSAWNDLSESEGRAAYVWQNADNMLTAIKHEGNYVPFYETFESTPNYHPPTAFETVDAGQSKIRLHTLHGLKYDVTDGNYDYPVAVGDAMFCFHPTNTHTSTTSGADAVAVDMRLPDTFTYTTLTADLASLADYSYVYTATTLSVVDDQRVVARSAAFHSACAIIRFNVTNATTSPIYIYGIKMEAEDGKKLFPDVRRFEEGTTHEVADKSGYYDRLTTSITAPTMAVGQRGVFYNLCLPLDGDFGHSPLVFTIDTNYLTYRLRLSTDVVTNNKFEAGKIYTFNFTLEEQDIRLSTIDIARCTTYNTDQTESMAIIVSPDATWTQTGISSAQMVFVSLGMEMTIDDKTYEVLWATCNLGAMESLETGNHYAWGETEKKPAENYSPAGYVGTATDDISATTDDPVRAWLGDGFWLWRMPTKEMWDRLLAECTWKWKTVKKVGDDGREDNLDFDASVWEVTKRDGEGKLVGIIYFPITGYSGRDAEGNYGRVNRARCHYWTSTPSSVGTGGEATAWAFETIYSIDPLDPSVGYMSSPQMVERERYNGYAIRPVLLKEK